MAGRGSDLTSTTPVGSCTQTAQSRLEEVDPLGRPGEAALCDPVERAGVLGQSLISLPKKERRAGLAEYQYDYPFVNLLALGGTLIFFGILLFIWWRAER